MTAHARARRRVRSRMAGLLLRARRQPDLTGRSYPGEAAGQDPAGRHAARQRPPWETAPIPAVGAALHRPYGGPGPDVLYGQDPPRLDIPEGLVRPYAPEPEPVPVRYPPLPPMSADYGDLPVFRAVTRGACRAGLRGIGVRQGAALLFLPDFTLTQYDGATDGLGVAS